MRSPQRVTEEEEGLISPQILLEAHDSSSFVRLHEFHAWKTPGMELGHRKMLSKRGIPLREEGKDQYI